MPLSKQIKYKKAVKEARNLLASMEKSKMRIAKLAYENCDIILGGHIVGEAYSLTMFAEDIGVNRKTLSDWVHNYEIKLILQREARKKKKFKKLLQNEESPKTQKQFNDIRKILRGKEGGLKKNLNSKSVIQAVEQVTYLTDDDRRVSALKRQIQNLEYVICHEGIDLTKIDQDDLAYIEGFAKNIHKKLSDYFEIYERPEVKLRKRVNTAGHRLAAKTKRNLRLAQ